MKVYDQKMYEFLTQAENFQPFVELYEQYSRVRSKLLDEFWQLVLKKIQDLWPPDSGWKVILDKANTPNRKLRATHTQLALPDAGYKAAVVYEFLDDRVILGAWFHRMHIGEDQFRKACTAAEKFRMQPGNSDWVVGKGGMWFPLYKTPGENFKEKDSLWKIIPEERDVLAQAFASEFFEALHALGNFCLTHGKTVHEWQETTQKTN